MTSMHENVHARVLYRTASGAEQLRSEFEADRFDGRLKRPVPRNTMFARCGVDRTGCHVIAQWSPQANIADLAQAGDLLELEGHRYTIWGVESRPGVYIDLYIDEHEVPSAAP
jgi:hypothetical protein